MNDMKKTKEGVNLKKKKFLRLKNTGSILVLMGLLIIFVIALYTFILQSSYTKTALDTEIARDTASADAVHKLVDGRISKEDFDQIKDQSDEKKQIYKDISSYFNEIRIRYVVQDNGIGMGEEFQKELFKPFSQEDNANARTKYKGTGLGMAITQKYVDMMGGSIAVESKKGVGSTFTVEIPLELSEQVIQSEQKQHLHRDLTGIHVLMAEDNDLNAELATIMLEDAGMTVTRASDGKEVVDLFKNHPRGTYDLILMDIMMPNMDGHQATKAIRALGIERSDAVTIPIIALSANAFIDDIQESLDSGMNDHISKPINMEEVTDTIAKYIKDDTCLEKELKQKQNDR